MAHPAPAALLADSIAAFSKSALKQLKDLEKQLGQANADIRDVRTERDNAFKQTRASQTELEAHKQDVVRYKSSLIQAEHTIETQTEVITQLHREVNRWKEQARNWHDHFTRVEEERCSLATRLDEMLAEQSQAFGIPAHLFSNIDASISAPVMKQSSTVDIVPSTNNHARSKGKPAIDSPSETPVRKPKTANARNKTRPEHTSKSASGGHISVPSGQTEDPAQDPPVSRLVRRVQAVIHVKSEEDADGDIYLSDNESLNDDGEYEPPQNTKPKRTAVARKTKQTARGDKGECPPTADTPQSAPLLGKQNKGFESDGDDELILGGETPLQARPTAHLNTDPPAKKRRLNQTTRQKPSKKV